jgi:hypothetical protein
MNEHRIHQSAREESEQRNASGVRLSRCTKKKNRLKAAGTVKP